MVLHPCHYWTHVNDEQIAQFIGRVESFDRDFERFCQFVQIETPAVQLVNVTTDEPRQVAGEYKDAAAMSRRALDRISDLFAKDFEYFDYEMV